MYWVGAYGLRGLSPARSFLLNVAIEKGRDSDLYIMWFVCIAYTVVALIFLAFILEATGWIEW